MPAAGPSPFLLLLLPASEPLSLQPSPLSILSAFFLTTSLTSFDVHAFHNPLENFPTIVRGNPASAKASQGPIT